MTRHTVLGGGARGAVLVGAGEWAPPPAPALIFRREMTKNMAIYENLSMAMLPHFFFGWMHVIVPLLQHTFRF
jgi:hypothetical protein